MRLGSGRPVAVRFWERATQEGEGCWLWQGAKLPNGYGKFKLARGVRVSAHRTAWELTRGPIPAGLHVCHRCDVKDCVNPAHLFLGTARDNVQDCVQKGRRAPQHGEHNGAARLTPTVVEAIRKRYATGGCSQYAVAREFGVSQSQVSRLVTGVRWASLETI